MNRTLALHAALQRALSPLRMLLVFSIVTFPAVVLSFAPQMGLHVLESGAVIAMILTAGLIGQETSSGVLQLLLARPVSRAEYIFSRWFAAGALATAAVVIEIALGSTVLTMRGAAPPIDAVGAVLLEQTLAAFGIVSVLTLFSCLLPGVGDIFAWIVLNVVGGVMQMAGGFMHSPGLVRTSEEWGRFLGPTLPLHGAFGGGVIAWFPIVSYFSTITFCLAMAIVLLNRREVSYASE